MGKFSNRLITTNVAIKKRFEEVHGIKYYRFSSEIDFIHLVKSESKTTLCSRELLGLNYAKYKPKGEICPSCEYEVLKTKKEKNGTTQ